MQLKTHIISSIKILVIMTILTGILYTVLTTVIAQLVFPNKSSGSMIEKNGEVIGSELIAQKFLSDKYFRSRPSAIDYNPLPSGASNLGPTSRVLKDFVEERRKHFIEENFLPLNTIAPTEMLFASGSGIDPHISPEAALLQVDRIAQARGFDEQKKALLKTLVQNHIEAPQFGFLGETRVNVLKLNLALDEKK
jgi:potassium-transporting ATPase KdpC subunit